MDQSGLYAIETAIQDLTALGITVMLTAIQQQPRSMMDKIHLVPELVPQEHVFESIADCEAYIRSII